MKQIVLIILCGLLVSATQAQTIDKPYDYPIRPGTVEWKQFKSRTEKAKILLIPDSILTNLTTKALAVSCLNFPMFKDIYFFNDLQIGFNTLRRLFNGFNELLTRKDAGYELLKLYIAMQPSELDPSWSEIQKGNFMFDFVAIEFLLAQKEIIGSLSETGIKKDLLYEAFTKYHKKRSISEFSAFGINPSVLILGRALDQDGKLGTLKNDDPLANFLASGLADTPGVIEQIVAIYTKSN